MKNATSVTSSPLAAVFHRSAHCFSKQITFTNPCYETIIAIRIQNINLSSTQSVVRVSIVNLTIHGMSLSFTVGEFLKPKNHDSLSV